MTRLFSDSLERPLTTREKIISRLHLYTCGACRRYVEQINLLRETTQNLLKAPPEAEDSKTPSLSAEARARIENALLETIAVRRNSENI